MFSTISPLSNPSLNRSIEVYLKYLISIRDMQSEISHTHNGCRETSMGFELNMFLLGFMFHVGLLAGWLASYATVVVHKARSLCGVSITAYAGALRVPRVMHADDKSGN